jgi:hypothetical protein
MARKASEKRLRKLWKQLRGNVAAIAKRIGYSKCGTYRAYARLRSIR